jgi:hypothetical protein
MDKADVEMFADMAGGDMDTQEMARQIEARYQQPGVDIDEAREDVKQLILDQGLGD